MRLEAIRTGDIVEVDRLGRRFHALVSGTDSDGLEILPLDRRVTYRTCRAQQVIAHWAKRGRPRAAPEQATPAREQGPRAREQGPPARERRPPTGEQRTPAPAPAPRQLELTLGGRSERQ